MPQRPLALDEKAEALLTPMAARDCIGGLLPRARGVADWTRRTVKRPCATSPRRKALKLGQVAQPLRAALTGRATSPGLFDVMAVLGRDECLARLRDQASDASRLSSRMSPFAWIAIRPY